MRSLYDNPSIPHFSFDPKARVLVFLCVFWRLVGRRWGFFRFCLGFVFFLFFGGVGCVFFFFGFWVFWVWVFFWFGVGVRTLWGVLFFFSLLSRLPAAVRIEMGFL